jgi:competence protein ComEA
MHRKSVVIMLAFLFVLVGCAKEVAQVPLENVEVEQEAEEEDKKQDGIFVFVCGAVVKAGVYELPAESRVFEAVQMAGGFSENAATAQINQAEMLEDGIRLYIPTMDEMMKEQSEEDGKVNINTAAKEELMTLPGVGEAKAALIVEYREEQGRFQKIEDIMNISGIKEGLFGKIKDYIKV